MQTKNGTSSDKHFKTLIGDKFVGNPHSLKTAQVSSKEK